MAVTLEQARAAKESAKELLASLPGVVGLGITKVGEDYALKVNLTEALPAGVTPPQHIDGVPLHLEIVGKIVKR